MSTKNISERGRGRPPVDSDLLRFRAERDVINGLDAYAAAQPDQPARPEVIRRLLREKLTELGHLSDDKS